MPKSKWLHPQKTSQDIIYNKYLPKNVQSLKIDFDKLQNTKFPLVLASSSLHKLIRDKSNLSSS